MKIVRKERTEFSNFVVHRYLRPMEVKRDFTRPMEPLSLSPAIFGGILFRIQFMNDQRQVSTEEEVTKNALVSYAYFDRSEVFSKEIASKIAEKRAARYFDRGSETAERVDFLSGDASNVLNAFLIPLRDTTVEEILISLTKYCESLEGASGGEAAEESLTPAEAVRMPWSLMALRSLLQTSYALQAENVALEAFVDRQNRLLQEVPEALHLKERYATLSR